MSGARRLELHAALRDHNFVLLDTCVLIEEYGYQHQHGQACLFRDVRAGQRSMPVVALWEFLHRDRGRLLPIEERHKRRKWLKANDIRVLSFHGRCSDSFRGILEQRAGPEGAVDCLIAAEGLARSCPVVTYNVKHFQTVQGLLLVGLQRP